MTAREVARILERLGATVVRKAGSHRRYVSACGRCATTLAMHPGDVPFGTLRSIQKAMEPCYGKGWLGV